MPPWRVERTTRMLEGASVHWARTKIGRLQVALTRSGGPELMILPKELGAFDLVTKRKHPAGTR